MGQTNAWKRLTEQPDQYHLLKRLADELDDDHDCHSILERDDSGNIESLSTAMRLDGKTLAVIATFSDSGFQCDWYEAPADSDSQ